MSNSIWKTDNLQEADTRKQVLFYAGGSSFPYLGWHYPNKGFGTWDYKDVQKWAYLSDVFAQVDKAERLQAKVDELEHVKNGWAKFAEQKDEQIQRLQKALDEAKDTLHWYDDNFDSGVARITLEEIKQLLTKGE